MNKLYLALIAIVASMGISNAQTLKVYQKAAIKATAERDYSAALGNYEVIIKSAGKETADNFYYAAEAARHLRIYPLAEQYYLRVLNSEEKNNYPHTEFWLGMVQKGMGNYEGAKVSFQSYLNGTGATGGTLAQKATKEIQDCEWAPGVIENANNIPVKHLDERVNSVYTELAPVLIEDQLYYSTLPENPSTVTCESPRTRIFMAKGEETGQEYNIHFNESGRHTAHTSFSSNGNRIYYTLCRNAEKDTIHCSIYYRDKTPAGDWGSANPLPGSINMANYTATQPAIGTDKNTGKDLLFFVSDRPGSKGKMDIWCSIMDFNGVFGTPFNIPEINTEENDITPFFDNESQTLYYSSDGLQNMGGFDIYQSYEASGNWKQPVHLGYPVNSSYDDLYYSVNTNKKVAHFSSNRPGSMCADTSQYCVCNDIYSVPMPEIKLKVLTFNAITGEPLLGTNVELKAPLLPDLEPQINSLDTSHVYGGFKVGFEKGYLVIATKDKYTPALSLMDKPAKFKFKTPPPGRDTTIEIKLYLRPHIDLVVNVFDKLTGEPLDGATVQFEPTYDLGIPKSQVDANMHRYSFDIDYNKNYEVFGTKPGYSVDRGSVSTVDIPVVPDTKEINLYLCKDVTLGTPNITLFFDNDIPKRNPRITTNKNYGELYQKYVNNYNGKKGNWKKHTNELDNFFQNEVRKGFSELEALSQSILEYFELPGKSNNIKVHIGGFASDLASAKYNERLTKRRISSIQNYFNNYVDPESSRSLKDYKDRIEVTETPNGSALACKGCYIKDPIRDVRACRDRAVRITGVTIVKNPCDNIDFTPKVPLLPALNLKVQVFDKTTGEPLNGAKVDLHFTGQLATLDTKMNLTSNDYTFGVNYNKNYTAIGSKTGYTLDEGSVEIGDMKNEKTERVIKLYLCKRGENCNKTIAPPHSIKLKILVFDKLTGEPLNGSKVELKRLNNGNLLDSKTDPSANAYHFGIQFNNGYKVVGTKPGYTIDEGSVTIGAPAEETTERTIKLYLCKTTADQPVVKLFFDNDEPEKDNTRTATSMTYTQAYESYTSDYNQQKGYYTSSNLHTPAMDAFFQTEVRKGFNDLEKLAREFLSYFENKKGTGDIHITIQGFASLRSNPKYNLALTKRRISSIQNYFNSWVDKDSGKSLQPYKGRIKVIEAPRGDREACKGCYEKEAITNVQACRDRRVEIIGVNYTKGICN